MFWMFWRRREAPPPPLAHWTLQDGQVLQRFTRFRSTGANAPNFSSLGHQLDHLNLDALYRDRGTAFIYQHLGVLYRSAGICTPATLDLLRERPEVFLAPWLRLAREVHEGRLWLGGVARILTYYQMLNATDVTVHPDDHFELSSSEVIGHPQSFLQGLTLYHDLKSLPRLSLAGVPIDTVANGPDETGRYSITVPFKKLDDIWP